MLGMGGLGKISAEGWECGDVYVRMRVVVKGLRLWTRMCVTNRPRLIDEVRPFNDL